MDSLRKALHIAGNNFRKWAANPRMYVILLLLLGYINMMLAPIRQFCRQSGHRAAPWVFPFLMAEPYSLLMVLLGLILLFCDAPFMDHQQPYMITRAGRKVWAAGQLLYIILASAVYFLTACLLTLLALLPCLSFESGWGKVLNTFAQGGAARYGVPLPFDPTIVRNFTPAGAMLTQLFLCWLLGAVLGMAMFLLNLTVSHSAGAIAAGAVAVFPIFVRKSDWGLHYFSPASWASLSVVDFIGATRFPDFSYVLAGFALLLIVLAALCLLAIARRDIEVLDSI